MSIGLGNIAKMMKNAKKIQSMVEDAQADFEKMQVTGTAGIDMVEVTMNGKHLISKIKISDEAKQESADVLGELIAAAANDATKKIETATQEKMHDAKSMMGLFDDDAS